MRKIPCELTLGNGGDVMVMLKVDAAGVLHVPRQATYGAFQEGVLACRVMRPEDQACVTGQVWVDAPARD